MLYFVKTGCQWRHLPHDFPLYSTVHSFYRRAKLNGLWNDILRHLVNKTREDAGRKPVPSYGIIDSQSVKTVGPSENRAITCTLRWNFKNIAQTTRIVKRKFSAANNEDLMEKWH